MIIGSFRGIFQEPRGCTSLKKRSTSTENVHRTRSYSHPIKGGIYGCFAILLSSFTLPRIPFSNLVALFSSRRVGGEETTKERAGDRTEWLYFPTKW